MKKTLSLLSFLLLLSAPASAVAARPTSVPDCGTVTMAKGGVNHSSQRR